MDFSKLSTEELQELIKSSKEAHAQNMPEEQNPLLRVGGNILKGYGNYAKGAARGLGQSIGDLGASAINWPISGIEHLIGKQLPHVPHPNLISENPESLSENIGQNIGQLAGAFALPGSAAIKGAQLANKGYSALRAGQQLPLLGKSVAAAAGGGLEGALGNEEDRLQGAELGAAIGSGGHLLGSGINFAKQLTSKNLAKNIKESFKDLSHDFNQRFTSHLQSAEEAGANKYLHPLKTDVKLLKKDNNGDLAYLVEKFNADPTLTNAHSAQSALGALERKYAMAPKGTVHADIYKEALKNKNRLLQKISESFEKAGVPEHGAGYNQSRIDFAEQAAPYINNPTIAGLLGRKSKTGESTVRPNKFAEMFFEDKKGKEKFLSKMGKKHPELVRREKVKTIAGHPATKIGALIGGGYAVSLLPHHISKALGLK